MNPRIRRATALAARLLPPKVRSRVRALYFDHRYRLADAYHAVLAQHSPLPRMHGRFLTLITNRVCNLHCKDCGTLTPYLGKQDLPGYFEPGAIARDLERLARVLHVRVIQLQGDITSEATAARARLVTTSRERSAAHAVRARAPRATPTPSTRATDSLAPRSIAAWGAGPTLTGVRMIAPASARPTSR